MTAVRALLALVLMTAFVACGGGEEDGTGGTGGGGAGAGGSGGGGGAAPLKKMKRVKGRLPMTVEDPTMEDEIPAAVKFVNPKTHKTVAVAEVADDGAFELVVGIYAEVEYVLIIEAEDGYSIGEIQSPTGVGDETVNYFPLDAGGKSGPDAVEIVGLGEIDVSIDGGNVFFVPATSPFMFVDSDEDGMPDFLDLDDDNDHVNDDMDEDANGDEEDDSAESDAAESAEEDAEEPDEGGGDMAEDTATEESAEDQDYDSSDEA